MTSMLLTKRTVEGLELPATGRKLVWDSNLTGFGLVLFPSGQRTAVLQYRNREGQSKRLTIGKICEGLTIDQARSIAKQHFASVVEGKDPAEHKRARRQAITINDLLDRYLASAAFAEKAESTKMTDRGRIARHVRPLLGSKIADKVTQEDVLKMKQDIAAGKTAGEVKTGNLRGLSRTRGGAGTADKTVLILRAAYTWANAEQLLKGNPCESVKVAQSNQRETIVDDADAYARIFTTLDKQERELRIRPEAADAIRLLALTGARRGEVAGLKWAHVDIPGARIVIPPRQHKTGRRTGKPRVIALAPEALAIIERQPRGEADDWVFQPARKTGGEITLGRPWKRLREEAGLPADLVMHSLRHSLASHLAMAGASAAELMVALGHQQISTTQRYLHFAERMRSTLAERAAAVAVAGMSKTKTKTAAKTKV